MDFESSEFYRNRDHFDVSVWWTASAIIGALPIALSIVFIAFVPPRLLPSLKPFWKANENQPRPTNMHADTVWLI